MTKANDGTSLFHNALNVSLSQYVNVMSIIMMNLMVGLAVDDITHIQDNAEIKKMSLNVGWLDFN